MRNGCERCDELEDLGRQDTDALIEAQLAMEVRNIVPNTIRDARLEICSSCPFF